MIVLLVLLGAGLILVVLAVYAAHIPGVRVVVGAEQVGPVPPLAEPLPQVLAAHHVTDGGP